MAKLEEFKYGCCIWQAHAICFYRHASEYLKDTVMQLQSIPNRFPFICTLPTRKVDSSERKKILERGIRAKRTEFGALSDRRIRLNKTSGLKWPKSGSLSMGIYQSPHTLFKVDKSRVWFFSFPLSTLEGPLTLNENIIIYSCLVYMEEEYRLQLNLCTIWRKSIKFIIIIISERAKGYDDLRFGALSGKAWSKSRSSRSLRSSSISVF